MSTDKLSRMKTIEIPLKTAMLGQGTFKIIIAEVKSSEIEFSSTNNS
jgi:hypothetical protein